MGDPTKKDADNPDNSGQEMPQHDDSAPSMEDGDIVIVDGEDSNLQEVIELGENQPEDEMAVDMEGMDMDQDEEAMAEEAMEPPREDAATIFKGHAGSVFCVNIDPKTATLVVSGGEDDKACVWDIKSGEIILECAGHKDSVTCCGFSPDSKYVATGDMSGYIQLWKLASKEMVWSFEVSDIEWMEWHNVANILFVGTTDGDMWMWKLPSGQCKTFQSHGSNCSVGKLLPDGKKLCAGYEDGVIKVWDLNSTNSAIQTFSGNNSHQGTITSIACQSDSKVILSGSTDLTAKLLNTLSGKVLATFDCSSQESSLGKSEDSVEAVGLSNVQTYAATGTLGGMMTIFDVPTQSIRHHCKHMGGIVRLRWSDTAPLLYTCSLDGVVNTWDARTGANVSQMYGHSAEILDMDIARDESVIVTGSGDNTARVFSLKTTDR